MRELMTATLVLGLATAAMAQTAGKYFTPEEKGTFATWLEAKGQVASTDDLIDYFLHTRWLSEERKTTNNPIMFFHARLADRSGKKHNRRGFQIGVGAQTRGHIAADHARHDDVQ